MAVEGSQAHAAARLFEFLREVQLLRAKRVLTLSEYTASSGIAIEMDSLPIIFGVDKSGLQDPTGSAPLLSVPRIPTVAAPNPSETLKPWLTSGWTSPASAPGLADSLTFSELNPADEDELLIDEQSLDAHPEIQALFDEWLLRWSAWANRERESKPVRELYQKLYVARETTAAASQDWELLLGVGRLRWLPADRHVLVQPIHIELDETTGSLNVMRDDVFVTEQDMLSPEQLPSVDAIAGLEADLGITYDDELMADRLKTYTNRLSPDAVYDVAPSNSSIPWMRLAPTLIQRKRSKMGLVEVLSQIANYLHDTDVVPEGILPLVDPDAAQSRPANMQPNPDGAVHWNETEYFLPLPVNAEQFEVIKRVDHQPLTLVQGPPGTGKTHTTAALVSHLLAQGKRVLVTAQTEQALHEVRDKLPVEIQDLAVPVLGTGQAERALLTRSVSVLAERAHHHSSTTTESEIQVLRNDLDAAAQRRAVSRNRLVAIREADVIKQRIAGFDGTRASIAGEIDVLRPKFDWALNLIDSNISEATPIADSEWRELLELLRDLTIEDESADLKQPLPVVAELPTATAFVIMTRELQEAEQTVAGYAAIAHLPRLQILKDSTRKNLDAAITHVRDVRTSMTAWEDRNEPWIADCLESINTGKISVWLSRKATIQTRLENAEALLVKVGEEHAVVVDEHLPESGKIMAQAVLDFLKTGETIKVDALGKPKLGMFSSKVVKTCSALFENSRVDGRAPVTAVSLIRLLARIDLTNELTALDSAWPLTVIPPEDTLHERLAWHRTEFEILTKLLDFADRMDAVVRLLADLGLKDVNLASVQEVDQIISFHALLGAEQTLAQRRAPVDALVTKLTAIDSPANPARLARTLIEATISRNAHLYTETLTRVADLAATSLSKNRRDDLLARVDRSAPELKRALVSDPANVVWDARIREMGQAWAWRYAAAWIDRTRPDNIHSLQQTIRDDEDQIREVVGKIAAKLAWSKSVGRLKQSQISDLVQYTQLVKRLGKGTGKYAARTQQDIRKVLLRCTDAVPVWIVPLHRVATQFKITPELFDVVIVDEASQAGLEATFLQFIAKKIVVVGDDKQVSPTVIIEQSNVHRLAAHYLGDSPYAATWSDPSRSLFDEARAKYHDLITLIEHRRCVPDIIGFSNEIAYEPDGIRLLPVREPGSSALEPIIPVFVENGYAEGTSSARRNLPEARAIVDAIKTALEDERYAGMSMGVISLLGDTQARLIESMLLEEVGPVEIQKRQLRCGVAATFQGAERDVIFLSMVSATDDQHTFAAQTKDTAVQRYNVAASRAKDQLWVFHSEPLSNLNNPEDLRRRLLEYANRVSQRLGSGIPGASQGLVPEDVRVQPFDSLFEQRVHNRIYERGYVLVPQYDALNYRIDLVVVGTRGKFAVECDGDFWHGPDRYLADLARQRELERCGWRFFRLGSSDFAVDPAKSLENLWPLLDALDAVEAPPEAPIPRATAFVAESDPAYVEVTSTPGSTPWREEYSEEASPLEQDAVFAEVEQSPILPGLDKVARGSVLSSSSWVERQLGIREEQTPTPESPRQLDNLNGAPSAATTPTATDTSASFSATDFPALALYEEWEPSGFLPSITHAPVADLAGYLHKIIEAEGPVTQERASRAYLRMSAGLRLSKNMADRLSRAFNRLVDEGRVRVEVTPFGDSGQERTFRIDTQPAVVLRQRGPRTLYEIPTSELRETMDHLATAEGLSGRPLWKAVLELYGYSRLEDKSEKFLMGIAQIPRQKS